MPKYPTSSTSDLDLHFPDSEIPLKRPSSPPPSWAQWMQETAERTRYFLKHHDRPEDRLAEKPTERFRL